MKEKWSKLLVPAYVFLMIAIIIIVIVSAIKKSKINNKETEEEIIPTKSETEVSTAEMFTATNLCIRTGPGTEFEILTIVPVNTMLSVIEDFNGWSHIIYNDRDCYVCSDYLSNDKINLVEPYEMRYYGLWFGSYCHLTPEEIDNKNNQTGITRIWQEYLYDKLAEKKCEWFYKYALAQALQESSWNPNATSDDGNNAGLFQISKKSWDEIYGDIYDYKANIDVYVDRICKYLVSVESDNDLYEAINQHKNSVENLDMNYVNRILCNIDYLWEQ